MLRGLAILVGNALASNRSGPDHDADAAVSETGNVAPTGGFYGSEVKSTWDKPGGASPMHAARRSNLEKYLAPSLLESLADGLAAENPGRFFDIQERKSAGYLQAKLTWWERILGLAAGASLILATPVSDEIGFVLSAIFIAQHVWRARRAEAATA